MLNLDPLDPPFFGVCFFGLEPLRDLPFFARALDVFVTRSRSGEGGKDRCSSDDDNSGSREVHFEGVCKALMRD